MIGGGRTPRSQIAFVCLLSFIPSLAQGQGNRSAQRFILDYDVPESPAFVALGVTPTNVTRGSASKPVIASLLTEFRTGQKIGGGLALDFAPYFVYGGRLDNIAAYRSDWKKRLLANLQLSLGTIQSETDTNSLRFGLGMRATFYDSHDLLMDPRLT